MYQDRIKNQMCMQNTNKNVQGIHWRRFDCFSIKRKNASLALNFDFVRLIWVCTVCLCHTKRALGLYELITF